MLGHQLLGTREGPGGSQGHWPHRPKMLFFPLDRPHSKTFPNSRHRAVEALTAVMGATCEFHLWVGPCTLDGGKHSLSSRSPDAAPAEAEQVQKELEGRNGHSAVTNGRWVSRRL